MAKDKTADQAPEEPTQEDVDAAVTAHNAEQIAAADAALAETKRREGEATVHGIKTTDGSGLQS